MRSDGLVYCVFSRGADGCHGDGASRRLLLPGRARTHAIKTAVKRLASEAKRSEGREEKMGRDFLSLLLVASEETAA